MIQSLYAISMAHIKSSTAEFLDIHSNPDELAPTELVVFQKGEYGYFVFVPVASEDLDDLPEELSRILDLAKRSNHDWVMFDRDYGVANGLPIYDW